MTSLFKSLTLRLSFSAFLLSAACGVHSADWAQWGGQNARNMVNENEKNLPSTFDAGKKKEGSEEIDLATTKNVKWVAKMGSQSFGNATIANGKVYVGTNNESPRDPKHQGDRGIIMCLDEKTGELVWQLVVPKLGSGKVSDWEFLGICSSPTVDGDRVYVVTNRCEVLSLDANGMADGNQGYQDEAKYTAGPGKPPIPSGPKDADIIWRYDMRDELGVFPHNASAGSILVIGEKLFATTSNGQDWTHVNVPSPKAPAVVCLNKKTGELLGEEQSQIGTRILHGSWSSPSSGKLNNKDVVLFGGPDGYIYGFDPDPIKNSDGDNVLRELFRYYGNPPERQKFKYPAAEGVNEYISTPVLRGGRLYAAIGQDPEHGEGVGMISCWDASKTGEVPLKDAIWSYDKIQRSISTASVTDDLIFISDFSGVLHCLDTKTGKAYWTEETKSHIWGSTYVADGKMYVGTEDGDVYVFEAAKEKKLLSKVNMGAPIYSTPVAANGVLYVSTQTHLYALINK